MDIFYPVMVFNRPNVFQIRQVVLWNLQLLYMIFQQRAENLVFEYSRTIDLYDMTTSSNAFHEVAYDFVNHNMLNYWPVNTCMNFKDKA